MMTMTLSFGMAGMFAECWRQLLNSPNLLQDLYTSGRLYEGADPNLLLKILARLVVIGAILGVAWVVTKILRRLVRRGYAAVAKRTGGEQQRLRTLEGLICSAITYLVYINALIPILFAIGLSWKALGALFATSSVALVAIGLGSQKLVRDLVNGLFILGEGQFDVDDWVTIGGVTGRVEEMGLRVTRLRDDQGRLYIIANGDINQVLNASRGNVKLVIDMTLQRTPALDSALQTIRATAYSVLEAHAPVEEDQVTLVLAGMDATKVTVRLTLWAPQKLLGTIEDQIRRRLLLAQEAEQLALV